MSKNNIREQHREELPKRTQHITDLASEIGIFEDQSKELIDSLRRLFNPKILLVGSKMLSEEDAYDYVTQLELINENISDLIEKVSIKTTSKTLADYEDPANID